MMADNRQLFEYIYQHLGIIGWPLALSVVWKMSKWLTEVTTLANKTVNQIDTMATNCFPHMTASLSNQDTLLQSMDDSLKVIADRLPERKAYVATVKRSKK